MLSLIDLEKALDKISEITDEYGLDYLTEEENVSKTIFKVNKKELKLIGEGASRVCFSINGLVIKIPKSEDGEMQTKKEIQILNENENLYFLPKFSKEYSILYNDIVVMELLTPISNHIKNKKQKTIIEFLNLKGRHKIQFEKDLMDFKDKYNLHYEDLISIQNWGMDKELNLKCFDFGLTEPVFKEYYL